MIERAAIASRTGLLRLELPASANSRAPKNPRASAPQPNLTDSPDAVSRLLSYAEVESLERENLLAALRLTHWKVSGKGGAAELLGVKATTLSSRIKAMGIHAPAEKRIQEIRLNLRFFVESVSVDGSCPLTSPERMIGPSRRARGLGSDLGRK